MRIGIISDTHDNVPRIKQAVAILNERKTDLVIHAGDYIAPFALDPLGDLRCQYVGVFGNNDGEKLGLSKRSQGRINIPPHSLEFGGRKILVMHDQSGLLPALVESQIYDIVIYGHTHEPVIEKQEGTLVINPGECGGWLTGKSTIALADLDKMTAELIELP
jgi:putative phosphoesterase